MKTTEEENKKRNINIKNWKFVVGPNRNGVINVS